MRGGIAMLGITALTLSACGGGSGSSGDGDTLAFTVVHSVTGAGANVASDVIIGMEAAADDINSNGGVDGKKIKIKVLDSQSDPTHAVSVLTKELANGRPDGIFPGGFSAELMAMLPAASDAELFSISASSTPPSNDPKTYPYHFGSALAYDQLLTLIGDDMAKKQLKKLGVVLTADAGGDAYMAAVEQASKELGFEITQVERPAPDALSLDTQLERINKADVDAIFFDFFSPDLIGRMLTSRATAGLTDVPVYAGGNTNANTPSTLVDAAATENCQMISYSFNVADEKLSHLQPLYDAFEGGERSIYSGGLGWDAVQLFALAAERTGGDTSASAMAEAIESERIPEDRFSLFPTGTSYSAESHFPKAEDGALTLIPCSASQSDGLFSTK